MRRYEIPDIKYEPQRSYAYFREKYQTYLNAFMVMIGDGSCPVPFDIVLWIGSFYYIKEQFDVRYGI